MRSLQTEKVLEVLHVIANVKELDMWIDRETDRKNIKKVQEYAPVARTSISLITHDGQGKNFPFYVLRVKYLVI